MNNRSLVDDFENIICRLLSREKIDLDATELSVMFEIIATNFFRDLPERKAQYFDGVPGLVAAVKTPRKVEFQGEMWVGGNKTQWTEPFHAVVTDMRSTKQGFRLVVTVGPDRAEGELSSVLGSV